MVLVNVDFIHCCALECRNNRSSINVFWHHSEIKPADFTSCCLKICSINTSILKHMHLRGRSNDTQSTKGTKDQKNFSIYYQGMYKRIAALWSIVWYIFVPQSSTAQWHKSQKQHHVPTCPSPLAFRMMPPAAPAEAARPWGRLAVCRTCLRPCPPHRGWTEAAAIEPQSTPAFNKDSSRSSQTAKTVCAHARHRILKS